MIQIKLKYGQNLMIYGNINNLDVFVNLASILRIVSFFEMPSDTIRPPKQKRGDHTQVIAEGGATTLHHHDLSVHGPPHTHHL